MDGSLPIPQIIAAELRSYLAANPCSEEVDLQLVFKGGGDNFQITSHQGGEFKVEQFSGFLVHPGGRNNACGGRGGGARTLAIIRAPETEEVVRTIVSSVERQIMAAGMADGCTVDGRFV